jgi:hypothetical protein
MTKELQLSASEDFLTRLDGKKFGTVLADRPWWSARLDLYQ